MLGTNVDASNTGKLGPENHQLLPFKRIPLTAEGSKFCFLLRKEAFPYAISEYSKLIYHIIL